MIIGELWVVGFQIHLLYRNATMCNLWSETIRLDIHVYIYDTFYIGMK